MAVSAKVPASLSWETLTRWAPGLCLSEAASQSLWKGDLLLRFPGIFPTPRVSGSHGSLVTHHVWLTFDHTRPARGGGHLWGSLSSP